MRPASNGLAEPCPPFWRPGGTWEGPTPAPEELSAIERGIEAAAASVCAGKVVLFPADTVYGFFGSALRPEAVTAVYEIKHRQRQKPFVLYTTAERVDQWAVVGPLPRRLIDHFWPRPLSLILPKQARLPDWFTAGNQTVAVMTASNHIFRGVAAAVDDPIFGTTVNYSGEPEVTTATAAVEFVGGVSVLIGDDSAQIYRQPSTMVDCTGSRPRVVREAAIPLSEINAVLPDALVDESGRIR